MTYQYLMLDMLAAAKERGGFINQKTFKTAWKYWFDSLILTSVNMHVLNGYISYIPQLLKLSYYFIIITENWGQHGKLG